MGAAGVTYTGVEVAEVILGTGNDRFFVDSTAVGVISAVHGGGGNDTLIVLGGGGPSSPLVLLGDTAQNATRFDSTPGVPSGHAIAFDGSGNDVIDASPSFAGVAMYGGGGHDILVGSQAGVDGALHGDDTLAGGAQDDLLFGQLGDDVLAGDGVVDQGSVSLRVLGAATDGDDYVEGNDGDNTIWGGLGQDDLVGGSSTMFGLTTPAMRPDGADTIYGGDGTKAGRNDAGSDHGRDADFVLGDNGNIYRVVALAGTYLNFAYDAGYGMRIIPRTHELLDYVGDNDATNDIGGGDTVHGEAGDDTVHGAAANDVLYGDAQDDDLYGEAGNDWISGGTGDDGTLGDDGALRTSRNGVAEPLHGIAATTQTYIETNDHAHKATLYAAGTLRKSAELASQDTYGGNDTLYGGHGNDSLHGGMGTDAVSGAEALELFFSDPRSTPALVFDAATGNFRDFDDANGLAKIASFLLNFDATEAAGNDGEDVLFGGDGADWLVGGSGRDLMYGGLGNDVLNADDDVDTSGVDAGSFGDTAYGGGGRDTLLGNTGADRLIDWSGELNAYLVPFSPFGEGTVSRDPMPSVVDFLIKLSAADGADQTRTGTAVAADYGELGLILRGQTGRPSDPQPGNAKARKDTR